jgi:hypothetical protein
VPAGHFIFNRCFAVVRFCGQDTLQCHHPVGQVPPKIEKLTRKPMSVPCLKHRPEFVPIDVGWQLFVDDFLIENVTLHRVYHAARYHAANPV